CGFDAGGPGKLVAAVPGYDVDLASTGGRLGGTGSRLHNHLLHRVGVILEPAAAEPSIIHAGNVVSHIVGALAMDAEKAAITPNAADIVEVCASSVSRGNERNQLGGTFRSRERIQRGVRDGDLLLEVLRVHHRNLLRHRD